MWFDEIMDDSKQALKIANKFKAIFIPIFINLGLLIAFGIYCLISGIVLFRNISTTIRSGFRDFDIITSILPSTIIIFIFTYILIIVFTSIMKAGTISLYKSAIKGIKPSSSNFFDGIKKSFTKILTGSFLLHLICVILSPILIALFVLYAATVGILSGGWGLVFLGAIISVFFAIWPIIVVADNIKPIKAIRISISLGRRYFWGLFVLMLSNIMLSRYISFVFGPVAAIIAGWFIAGVIQTYFEVIMFLVYNRKKEFLINNTAITK